MIIKTEYIIFHRTKNNNFKEISRVYAATGRQAIKNYLNNVKDDYEDLAKCDVASCPVWSFYKEHYDPN